MLIKSWKLCEYENTQKTEQKASKCVYLQLDLYNCVSVHAYGSLGMSRNLSSSVTKLEKNTRWSWHDTDISKILIKFWLFWRETNYSFEVYFLADSFILAKYIASLYVFSRGKEIRKRLHTGYDNSMKFYVNVCMSAVFLALSNKKRFSLLKYL